MRWLYRCRSAGHALAILALTFLWPHFPCACAGLLWTKWQVKQVALPRLEVGYREIDTDRQARLRPSPVLGVLRVHVDQFVRQLVWKLAGL
jgi:hypothetical protein